MAKRTFCFELTADEISDKAKLVTYAEKMPPVKPTAGSQSKHEDQIMMRTAFAKVVSTLWRHPDLCMKAEKWLDERANMVDNPKVDGVLRQSPDDSLPRW